MMHHAAIPTRVPIEIGICIANEQTSLAIDRQMLRRAVRLVLRNAGVRRARISLAVVEDVAMARLNWKYLRHRGPTDVLSFVLDESESALDGEVVVCAETAIRTAPKYGWSAHDELLLYVIHGTLHLVGHDDATDALRATMQRQEAALLQKLGIDLRVGMVKQPTPSTNH